MKFTPRIFDGLGFEKLILKNSFKENSNYSHGNLQIW